ncbi:MAG: ABC transporter permease subunit [Chloroflexi bacterium]|nr:ABC transporter permease subunit [Chloroflexota bacterium]
MEQEKNQGLPSRTRLWWSAARYLAGKVLSIALTIFIGVFATLLIANTPSPRGLGPAISPFQSSLESQVTQYIRAAAFQGLIPPIPFGSALPEEALALEKELRSDAGLDLPYLPRYLLWTLKALTFNWGRLSVSYADPSGFGFSAQVLKGDVVLQHLPNTLLLVGTSYLLILLIGMPLALYLARHYGNWLDRMLSALSPLSSVPSWVIAILLIAFFAVRLRWLPVGGKFDFVQSQDPVEAALDLARHMILPVSAIVFSLLFQVVSTWRTFFILYSEEDYVDLARAKGLPSRVLENRYILRPALPYVMTSFATLLIGFWQLTVALEVVFQWPGIGWLYIKEALPDFWGESVAPGQLMLVIEIVVIFAYLLGAMVFFLDLAYVLVDPRIHLLPPQSGVEPKVRTRSLWRNWVARSEAPARRESSRKPDQLAGPVRSKHISWRERLRRWLEVIGGLRSRSAFFLHELRRYPSAIFGLTVIAIMFAGSVYAVTALPYEQYGQAYDTSRVSGRSYSPRTAAPSWTNLFSAVPRLSSLIFEEGSPQVHTSLRVLENGWIEKTSTFTFDYSYREIPSEVFLYLNADYKEKMPFVSMVWVTPDGRHLSLKPKAVAGNTSYDFESGIPTLKLLDQDPQWKGWFVREAVQPTPAFTLLFAKPAVDRPIPEPGTYQLVITSLLFEQDSDLHPQLVLLGQVYGMAGTDYWRRDLVVPLLWGMPFALLIGLFGTLIMLFVAMLLPAIGVWYGGWLDNFIQRLTEVNMVLPGLTIAVLAYALFGINIWVILGVVVVINAFGAPIKTFRSALLQAKEALYIEAARSYGASNFRIITRYLVPRILPVLIPQLVTQVPSFIFLEATLGFFNIKSNYPSWGRIIYDGLSHGALYGSPFWVLAPIFLLLLTGFAFAMLGSALERVLNPRIIDQAPAAMEVKRIDGG